MIIALYLIAFVIIIVAAKAIVVEAEKREWKLNRWIIGVTAVVLLTVGIVFVPNTMNILRGLMIGLSLLGAMIFLDLNRKVFEVKFDRAETMQENARKMAKNKR